MYEKHGLILGKRQAFNQVLPALLALLEIAKNNVCLR